MNPKSIRKVVCYRGHVQGVGFRMTALAQANGLNVHGFVRNQPDGSVLMDVEGPAKDIATLLDRIADAMAANIDDVASDQPTARGIDGGFHISH